MSEEDDQDVFRVNVNLTKLNVSMVCICVLLSYFIDQYEYLRIVYNCLITIFIYNNLIFFYLVYRQIKKTWKN
jgi:hypothetical protein